MPAPQAGAAVVVAARRHQAADLVRIGDPEPGKRADLARFHVGGVGVVVMVVAEQVQRSVHDQMRGMLLERHAFFRRLGFADAMREDNIAEQQFRLGNIFIAQAHRLPPSGRRGRWSACPCRASGR